MTSLCTVTNLRYFQTFGEALAIPKRNMDSKELHLMRHSLALPECRPSMGDQGLWQQNDHTRNHPGECHEWASTIVQHCFLLHDLRFQDCLVMLCLI